MPNTINVEKIITQINGLSRVIIYNVTRAINAKIKEVGTLDDYEIVWKQLQTIASKVIKIILEKEFPGCKITIAKSKSTYPDVKMEYGGYIFAFDIKSNETQKEPWYDMARIDTIIEKRIDVYDEEWELVLRYDSVSKKFIKSYFSLFRKAVGKNDETRGIKFRPYDGKVRPKSWDDFDKNIVYWKTKEEYMEGIRKSQVKRWERLIRTVLVPILDVKEKVKFKSLFD